MYFIILSTEFLPKNLSRIFFRLKSTELSTEYRYRRYFFSKVSVPILSLLINYRVPTSDCGDQAGKFAWCVPWASSLTRCFYYLSSYSSKGLLLVYHQFGFSMGCGPCIKLRLRSIRTNCQPHYCIVSLLPFSERDPKITKQKLAWYVTL